MSNQRDSTAAPTGIPSAAGGRGYHHGDLRNGLLEAARTILEEESLSALTLRAVARKAGVSHAAPYRHFPNHEALLVELSIEGFDELREALAEAAKAQGKFWEYIDIMFKNQTALDQDSLRKYATQVGLDRKRFDAELEAGKYEPVIRRDIEDGEVYGVEATPTFFINGVVLTEYSAEGVRAAIEKAFARAGKRTS